jgi:pimeloyl-ACP methyl ester carboxylesterase
VSALAVTPLDTLDGELVTVAGLKTRYVRRGSGFPVVLIHGSSPGACAEINWAANIDALAGRGFAVYAYDQPGFGLTDNPTDYSVEFRVRHAQALVEALALPRYALVGNSMGGYLAVRIALEDPRASHLVLVAPVPMAPGVADRATAESRAHSAKLREFTPGLANMQTLTTGTFSDPARIPPGLVDLRHRMTTGKNEDALAGRRTAPGPQPIGDRLAGLTARTLLVWGLQDRSVSVDEMLPLARTIRGAEAHVFDGAGHWPQWEHAARFNDVVSEFLRTERKG